MFSEIAPEIVASAPAECLLQRHDQNARRGAHADGCEDDGEHDADDDPGIMDAPGQQPGKAMRPHASPPALAIQHDDRHTIVKKIHDDRHAK